MTVVTTPTDAPPASSSTSHVGGGGFSWAALVFLGPAALLLIVFLVYPTIYTLFLSFNRGRAGELRKLVEPDRHSRLPYFRACLVSRARAFQRRFSSRATRLFERASMDRSSRSSLR